MGCYAFWLLCLRKSCYIWYLRVSVLLWWIIGLFVRLVLYDLGFVGVRLWLDNFDA